MTPEITKIFELLGLWVIPALCSSDLRRFLLVRYAGFCAGESRIVGWLKPLDYDRAAVANAILEVFDRIYSRPLLSLRAFVRSALISIALTIAFILEQASYLVVDANCLTT